MANIKHHLLVLLATALVAGSFLASEKLAGVINPISLTLLRFLGASLLLLPIVLFRSRWRAKILSTLPRAMIISLFYALFFIGLFESLNTTSALNTGALFTLMPFITALLAIFAFRESISNKQIFVYFIGVTGAIWVVFGGQWDLLLSLSLNSGDLLFIVALFFMCFYTLAMKWLYRGDEMIVLVFCTLVGGSFWMLLALLASGESLQWDLMRNDSMLQMAYLIVAATLATAYLYQTTTVVLGPTRVNAYIYLNPALIATLLLVIDGEPIAIAIMPGILISVVATVLLQQSKATEVTVKPKASG